MSKTFKKGQSKQATLSKAVEGILSIVDDLTNKPLQSSPDCYVRIVRYNRRDTRDIDPKDRHPTTPIAKHQGIRHLQAVNENEKSSDSPDLMIDIVSDIISCNITKNKNSSSGTFSLVLSPGDINYHHVVHPGDHIFIWMKRSRAQSVAKNERGLMPDTIANNEKDSGLKLYGVITGIRKIFRTSADGRKILYYQLTGKDFGYFFEAEVFYNPNISEMFLDSGLFMKTQFGVFGFPVLNPGQLAGHLIGAYLGYGPKEKGGTATNQTILPATENTIFKLPTGVKTIFSNKGGASTIADILEKRIGIESYVKGQLSPPVSLPPLKGIKQFRIDAGNQYPLWSLLKTYSNPAINEMFTDLKISAINKKIVPIFTMRQIPFTTSKAKVKLGSTTSFTELPRLIIPETFIINEDIGRGDHERFNLIELFGVYDGLEDFVTVAQQQILGNYAVDVRSVQRYGLRTFIAKTDYQIPQSFVGLFKQTTNTVEGEEVNIQEGSKLSAKDKAKVVSNTLVPYWIGLLNNWYMGAHTLESGSFTFVGIEEPLSIGDNIEIVRGNNAVNELYHVESYSHSYSIGMESGEKTFRTTVNVTRGQRVDEFPLYGSENFSEDDISDIGLTDTEFESSARSSSAVNEKEQALTQLELPKNRKKG